MHRDAGTWHGYECHDAVAPCASDDACDTAVIECAGTPLLNQIQDLHSLLTSAGLAGKPIFDTEGNWNRNQYLPDINDEIAYVARWFIL